jgi:hypothetical protein
MKNSFKFGFLALAISLSVAACNSTKTEEAATDSVPAMDTTAVVDTAAVVDSAAADTAAAQ